jgi:hypothetical protein
MSMANFRERLRGDRNFRDRFLEEVLIMIAVQSGMVNPETGELADDRMQRRVTQPRVVIAGRPLRHYYGQSEESLDRMGLTEEQKDQVRQYLNLGDASEQQHVALGYNWPAEAPAPPSDIPLADDEGREHPSLAAWRESQASQPAEPQAPSEGEKGGKAEDAPPAPEVVAARSATPDNPNGEGANDPPKEPETDPKSKSRK